MMGTLSVAVLANLVLERATLWHRLMAASSSRDSNRLDQGCCPNGRCEKNSNAAKCSQNSLLIGGHWLESVVGSLPNTCTISAGFVGLWSPTGQALEQFW